MDSDLWMRVDVEAVKHHDQVLERFENLVHVFLNRLHATRQGEHKAMA
jgi:hypothetical protein